MELPESLEFRAEEICRPYGANAGDVFCVGPPCGQGGRSAGAVDVSGADMRETETGDRLGGKRTYSSGVPSSR
jgi:hypothetical protein